MNCILYTLRIQVHPKEGVTQRESYSENGIGTRKILFKRKCLDSVLSALGMVTSDRFAPIDSRGSAGDGADEEGEMADGFRKLGLSTGSNGAKHLTALVTKLLILALYGHSTSNCCSSKHARFVDRFMGGPRLMDLQRDTSSQLAEVVDATYLKMVITLGDTYLVHEKKELLTGEVLQYMDTPGGMINLEGSKERSFAATSQLSTRWPVQVLYHLGLLIVLSCRINI